MANLNDEKFVKEKLNEYINNIEIPTKKLEGIIMNNLEIGTNEEKANNGRKKKIIARAACFVAVAGVVGAASLINFRKTDDNPTITATNTQLQTTDGIANPEQTQGNEIENTYNNINGEFIGFKGQELNIIALNDEKMKFDFKGIHGTNPVSGIAEKVPDNEDEGKFRFEYDGTESGEDNLITGDRENCPKAHYRYTTTIDGKSYKIIFYFTSTENVTYLEWNDETIYTDENCSMAANLVKYKDDDEEQTQQNAEENTKSEPIVKGERKLTKAEMADYEEILNEYFAGYVSASNTYTKPSEIDLTHIFVPENRPEDCKQEELEYFEKNVESIPTGLIKITVEDAKRIYENHTKEKLSDADLKRRLKDWEYLEKYDAYYIKPEYVLKEVFFAEYVKVLSGTVDKEIIEKETVYGGEDFYEIEKYLTINLDNGCTVKLIEEVEHLEGGAGGVDWKFISNIKNNTNKTEEKVSKENEAIRKAFKDDSWLEKNLGIDIYQKDTLKFAKGTDDNGMPVYVIQKGDEEEGQYAYFVTYKDGQVVVSEVMGGKDKICYFEADSNVLEIAEDDIVILYVFTNGKVTKIAESKLNKNDNTVYYYINNENVSYGRFATYKEGCKELAIELHDVNVDKYVK